MNIKTLVLGPVYTNCYIVYENGAGFVIDPADDADRIYREALGIRIKYIIITHAHFDHIAAAKELSSLTGAEIVVSEKDSAALYTPELNLCAGFGDTFPETRADITVNDGDTLSFGGFSLKFIMTPGHTKGSMSVFVNEETLFSGDTLFCESIGRTDFPGGSYAEIISSIRNKLFVLPDSTKVFPGHGNYTTVAYEKLRNPFFNGENI